jgi:hypothetical protein
MNFAAAGISSLIGSAFLAVGIIIPYYPSLFGLGDSVQSVLSAEQAKARAAVYKLLIDPNSAKFYAVREVNIDTARYVCGNVDSKDREGSYAGQHAFVYEDRSDSAAIDDAGLISRPHTAFKPCPVPEEVQPGPLVVDLGKATAIAKMLPKAELHGLSSPQSSGGGSDGSDAGQSMQQTLARLGPSEAGPNAVQTSDAAEAASSKPSATVADEKQWRSDRPPEAWPKFAADDPLSKPGPKLTDSEAIELASEIENRWKRFETGKSATHPSASEIEEALRALMAIKRQSPQFPPAWAAFVRLRKIHHAATMLAERG